MYCDLLTVEKVDFLISNACQNSLLYGKLYRCLLFSELFSVTKVECMWLHIKRAFMEACWQHQLVCQSYWPIYHARDMTTWSRYQPMCEGPRKHLWSSNSSFDQCACRLRQSKLDHLEYLNALVCIVGIRLETQQMGLSDISLHSDVRLVDTAHIAAF